jgi:hypothetical protein
MHYFDVLFHHEFNLTGKRSRKMKKLVIAAVAIAVVASVLIAIRGVSEREEHKKTPEYSLLQLEEAVKNHDMVTFEKYVDVQGVIDDLVDPFHEVATKKAQPSIELTALGELIYRKLRYPSKSRLAEATRCQLTAYVETGEYNPECNEPEARNPEVLLASIWHEAIGGTAAFDGIEYIESEGEATHAGLNVRFEEYKVTLVLDLIMESRGDYWQVTGLGNFPDFMQQLVVLRNKHVLMAMNETLVLEDVEKSITDGRWGIGKKVIFETKVKNQGKKEIDKYALKIICIAKGGEELDSFVITNRGNIPPGNEGEGFWYRDINVFTGKGKMLYETDRSDMLITTSVKSIVFADESTLELWGDQEEMG